jgi:L-2-hydroxyglutarate oxidase LhgO
VITNKGKVECDHVINAAGLESLAVAHKFGFGKSLIMVPFKGRYAIST